MPSLPDPRRGDAVLAVMTRIALAEGLSGLSLRAIATQVGIAPSTLVAQFTHRKRLLTWFSAVTGKDRLRQWDRELDRHRLEALLPRDVEALEREAVWSLVAELGRTDEDVSDVVQGQVEGERAAIGYALRLLAAEREGGGVTPQPVPAADPDEILLVAAVLAGLRAAMVRTLEPMPVDEAKRLLHLAHDALHGVGRPASEEGEGSRGDSAA